MEHLEPALVLFVAVGAVGHEDHGFLGRDMAEGEGPFVEHLADERVGVHRGRKVEAERGLQRRQ